MTARELDCLCYYAIREARDHIRRYDERAEELQAAMPSTLDCAIHHIRNGDPLAVMAERWLRSVVK